MAEIRHRESTWSVWTHGCPNGEQVDQVQRRSEQTIDRMLMIPKPGDIALFADGHSFRDLAGTWLALASRGANRSPEHRRSIHEHRRRTLM